MKNSKPNILILGGNFAWLGSAQKIRDYAKDHVDITVIDRKAFLDYIPNIPLEIFEGRNPAVTMNMELAGTLAHDDIAFHQAGEHHYLHPSRADRRGRRRKSSWPTPGDRIVDGIQIHQ